MGNSDACCAAFNAFFKTSLASDSESFSVHSLASCGHCHNNCCWSRFGLVAGHHGTWFVAYFCTVVAGRKWQTNKNEFFIIFAVDAHVPLTSSRRVDRNRFVWNIYASFNHRSTLENKQRTSSLTIESWVIVTECKSAQNCSERISFSSFNSVFRS